MSPAILDLDELLKFKHEEIKESVSVLDSEDLVNKAYEGLLTVLSLYPKGRGLEVYSLNHENHVDGDIFTPLLTGIYIPGSKRLYWAGHVDIAVDLVVARGTVYLVPDDKCDYSYVSVVELDKFPNYVYDGDRHAKFYFKVMSV